MRPGDEATSDQTANDAGFTGFVHAELRPFLDLMKEMIGPPVVDDHILPERRRRIVAQPYLEAPAWRDVVIPGLNGEPEVRVYVVNAGATGEAAKPAILYMHGGGFVLSDASVAIRQLQELAAQLDCVIVSVDYRLAPETAFPGPLNDNYAGLKWLHDNAEGLGVDASRLALMGVSAGGGHAAMLAIAARDRGEIPLLYQALVYPMLDDRTGSSRTLPPQQGRFVWTPAENRYGWSAVLGMPAGSPETPYGSVPARVDDLRGLPPAFIGVGSIDLFADENLEYARRLISAGVPTELLVVPGAFHGFDALAQTKVAQHFKAALAAALSKAFQD